MYDENREAVFWSTPEECAAQCHRLLRDEETRRRIAFAGRQRVLASKQSTDDVVRRILEILREVIMAPAGLDPAGSRVEAVGALS